MTIEHRPTKANELPLIEAPATAELIGVLDGATGRVPVARIAELVAEGKSTYQVAVANGFEGTAAEWLDSIIGDLVDQAGLDEAEAQAARDAALAAQAAAEAAADNAVAVSGLADLSASQKRVIQAADTVFAVPYDLAKDTDGGEWLRRLVPHVWMAGELPRALLIVGHTSRTIRVYDFDNPASGGALYTSPPVAGKNTWANLDGSALTCTWAGEGFLVFGGTGVNTGGLTFVDLVKNRMWAHRTGGVVDFGETADPGTSWTQPGILPGTSAKAIGEVNVVDGVVLPGTLPDPARLGLCMPVIACGTPTGVVVRLPDGRVTKSTSTGTVTGVAFMDNGDLVWQSASNWGTTFTRPDQYLVDNFNGTLFGQIGDVIAFRYAAALWDRRVATAQTGAVNGRLNIFDFDGWGGAVGTVDGVQITDKSITGHHFGQGSSRVTDLILSPDDSDLADIVEETPWESDFAADADQAAAEAAGLSFGGGASFDAADDKVVCDDPVGLAFVNKTVTITSPGTYVLEAVVSDFTDGGLYVSAANGTATVSLSGNVSLAAVGTIRRLVTVPAAGTFSWGVYWAAGSTAKVSSMAVRRCLADLSGKGTPAIVEGTFQREVVAAGAQLAAYKGVDHAGVRCPTIPWDTLKERALVMWRRDPGLNGNQVIAGWGLTAYNESAPPARWGLITGWNNVDINGSLRYAERANNMLSRPIITGQWDMVILLLRKLADGSYRREMWINGELHNFGTQGNPGIAADEPLRLFQGSNDGDGPAQPTAILRHMTRAPSPEQIRKWYREEKELMHAGRRYGLGDRDVRKVSRGRVPGEMLVARKGGTDIYRGLVRERVIDNAAVGDPAKLSGAYHVDVAALNGAIAIATSGEVFAEFPPVALRPELLDRNTPRRYDPNVVVNSIVTTGVAPTPIIAVPTPFGVTRAFTARVSCGEIEKSGAFKRGLYQVNGMVESRLHMGTFGFHADTPQTFYESDSGLNITVTMDTSTGVLFVNAVGLASRALRWSARLEFLPEV